jgi:hypothetical protein
VDDGKPPNPIKTVICDPGSRKFEAQKPGLFYNIISKGTTMGTLKNGKRSGSAIYFYDYGFGSVMTPAQITNLRVSVKTNQTYVTIRKRDKWVSHLQKTNYKNTKKMMKSRNYSNGQNIKKCLPRILTHYSTQNQNGEQKSDNYNLYS